MPKQRNNGGNAPDLLTLADIVERFEGKRVLVLGDFVADSFQYGDITRVSREAPVLILRHRETRILPGGAANASNNFAARPRELAPGRVPPDESRCLRHHSDQRPPDPDENPFSRRLDAHGWTAGFARGLRAARADR